MVLLRKAPRLPYCLLLQRVCRGQARERAAWVRHGAAPASCLVSSLRGTAVQKSHSFLTRTKLPSAKPWCLVLLLWLQVVSSRRVFYVRAEENGQKALME